MEMEMEMEMPECPVCLQAYNEEEKIIPRVLSCGHSTCESCILQLPHRFPNAISCPSCTQLVQFPNSQGPSSLPKNIDLLRFFPSKPLSHSNHIKAIPTIDHDHDHAFLPRIWTPHFYSLWKPWILPINTIKPDSVFSSATATATATATSSSSSNFPFSPFRENQRVNLLPIASSLISSNESCFSLDYTARVMEALYRMRDVERTELGFLEKVSLMQRRVCRVYGVWMDLENGSLFLVFERFDGDFSKRVSEEFENGVVGVVDDEKRNLGVNDAVLGFAGLGLEMCEAVMGLHLEGVAVGLLAPSCFGFDGFGHLGIDLNGVLVLARRLGKSVVDDVGSGRRSDSDTNNVGFEFDDLLKSQAFVSPEMFVLLLGRRGSGERGLGILDSYKSDVWSLACILVRILVGERFNEELLNGFYHHLLTRTEENHDELLGMYTVWMENVISTLDNLLGADFAVLVRTLSQCLNYDPGSRPSVSDLWRCIRGLFIKPSIDLVGLDIPFVSEIAVHCLVLGDLSLPRKRENKSQMQKRDDLDSCHDIVDNISGLSLHGSSGDVGSVSCGDVDKDLVEGLQVGDVRSVTLQGHNDCITGLVIGGGFLFSSSFDKTVHVWSLQDFSHVQSLRGHEHRVMAVVVVDADNPLCISGDSGGGIFVWSVGISPGKELLKKWYERNDWRYSGVHSLAVGTDYLYSGSGDKSIKAWSMKDYTLVCTMTGHKSVVSSLAVCNGVLYSGSWDGTVRLWWLSDHSPLAVLGDDTPGNITSVLSLSVDRHILVASYENGCVKMWKNDVLVSTRQTLDGSIFALEKMGKWLFMGGWNKIVDIQELSEDEFQVDMRPIGTIACNSVITALLYWQGKLFVGLSDRVIKVYHCRP